jgi:hypothetical protein
MNKITLRSPREESLPGFAVAIPERERGRTWLVLNVTELALTLLIVGALALTAMILPR